MSVAYAKRYAREVASIGRADIDAAKERILSGQVPILSTNLTCGVSVNVAISHTCKTDGRSGEGASPLCAVGCYAKQGRIGMSMSVVKSMAVYEIINEEPTDFVAALIHAAFVPHARKLKGRLRHNAVGDLFPAQVRLINHMIDHADRYPYIERHYLYTKRPSLANQLSHRPDKLALFISLDASNGRIAQLVTWPWAQGAWMVTDPAEIIPDTVPARTPSGTLPITILFPDHAIAHTIPTTARTCAKLRNDGTGVPMKLACATCTHCSEDPRENLIALAVAA